MEAESDPMLYNLLRKQRKGSDIQYINKNKIFIFYSKIIMYSPLVNKLMACAKAIADGKHELADQLYCDIQGLIPAETNEGTKKSVQCFAEALARKVHEIRPPNPIPLHPSAEMRNYPNCENFPFYHFASIATNPNILQPLIAGRSKLVHFIDFSMVVGSWYWKLCMGHYAHSFGCSSPAFRLTSIRPKLSKHDDCERVITPFARENGIDFWYNQVFANSTSDLVNAVLQLERKSENETIIVRWAFELHKLLAEEGSMETVLSKLKSLRPDVMVIVEQEGNHNTSNFYDRFISSFRYYRSVFESSEKYDADPSTKQLWERHLRRQISNIIASEGSERFERHENVNCWQKRLSQAGFLSIPLSCKELENYRIQSSAFRIENTNGFLMLCLPDIGPTAVVSVWKPINSTRFSNGGDPNNPIIIQDTRASPLVETEAASSSDSDDDRAYDPKINRNGGIWSKEEVQNYLASPISEREFKRINRWTMSRQMTRTVAGRNKKLQVVDTSLASLLRIPPRNIPIEQERLYYVDDSLINAFFELLKKRSENFPNLYFKNYSLPTQIMNLFLSGQRNETQVLSYLQIEEIKDTSKLFMPVCLGFHWILICADLEKRNFLWLDSLNSSPKIYRNEKYTISEWAKRHLLPKLGYHIVNEWKFWERREDIPMQENTVDCGIFVMKYADCLAHGNCFPFTQEDIQHFRYRVFLDLYRGKLLLPAPLY